MSLGLNEIHHGNCLDLLRKMDDESVNCVITSPPYWGLRDYGLESVVWGSGSECEHEWGVENIRKTSDNFNEGFNERYGNSSGQRKQEASSYGQINQGQYCQLCGAWRGSLGLEPTFELYISHLIQIFNEIKRVLKADGTCWVNLGDSYGGSGGPGTWVDNKQTEGFKRDFNKYTNPNRDAVAKSLCQIPSRFAIAMTDAGWILRNELIWYKRNCMPSSAKDRFTVDFEKIFFFTKNKKYWFEQQFDALKSKPHNPGNSNRVAMTHHFDEPDRVWGDERGKNKRCVWDITTQPFSEAHFAVFPEELVETPILAGCPEAGVVLDPFMGSGTVAKVALRANRQFIGLEANQEYIDMANKRISFHLNQMRLL